jgi:CBS domain containing-hemolysin-like protein
MFFSVSAIALRIFSRGKLQDAFEQVRRKELANNLVSNVDKLLWTCCIYRLISNTCILILLLASVAWGRETIAAGSFILVFIIAVPILLIFDHAIPQVWAKYAGEKFLSHTYKLLMFCALIAGPIIYVFDLKLYDGLIRRLAGIAESTPEEKQEEKQEEFLNGLEQRRREGVVDEEQQEMIENVLELSDKTADEIMTPRTDIVAIEVNSDLAAILETIIAAGHSRVPVYEENIDKIIGLIYAKDLLTEVGTESGHFKLRSKMRGAYFVPETKHLRALFREFQNQKLHIAVVLDEYGGTAGIVTLEDILEELVGEITDEYEETPQEPIKKIDLSTADVDARTGIDDLNDELDLNLPEDEDYDTIGGFVFSHLGYIPKSGDSFDYKNLKFTIIAAETRRIKRIKIQIVTSDS